MTQQFVELLLSEQADIALSGQGVNGMPAALDSQDVIPQWTLKQGDATITPSPDGMSCNVFPNAATSGSNPVVIVGVTADADLDLAETRILEHEIVMTVKPDEAASLTGNIAITPKP